MATKKRQRTLLILLATLLIIALLFMLGAYLITQTTVMDRFMGKLFSHAQNTQ
ncbi:MAG TPA: hypothetical protein VJM76_07095 [Gammaproteobacteria bacterium]|nr:hypothetical protein [Gammaproteobacteria bacterium]